jgi:YgiT-type zinc finger domain-containing protein
MKETKVSQFIRIAGQEIFVENIPARVCNECGEVHLEGRFILDLETKLLKRQRQAA